jgi:hypothetical protein
MSEKPGLGGVGAFRLLPQDLILESQPQRALNHPVYVQANQGVR